MACSFNLNIQTDACLATKINGNIHFIDPPDGQIYSYVFFSYLGSTLVEGIDFTGPHRMNIAYPWSGAPFVIDILRKSNFGKNEKIVITATTINTTCAPQTKTITIADCDYEGEPEDPEEDQPYERPDRDYGTYVSRIDYLATRCCKYVPKKFIAWSDGIGVPVLTPPNRR